MIAHNTLIFNTSALVSEKLKLLANILKYVTIFRKADLLQHNLLSGTRQIWLPRTDL